MSKRAPHGGATYDDLLRVPDHLVAELIDGELFASPRPATRHAIASSTLLQSLAPFDRGKGGPGGWWILFEPELHLDNDVLVPDLAGWRRETMPSMPDIAAFTQSPDWICEVVSPQTARLDRLLKLPRYARNAVGHAWIIDPIARGLEVFRLEGEHYSLIDTFMGEDVVRAEPFEAIELDLATLWLP